MSAVVAHYSKVPMTCRTCTRPEAVELRRLWGCDGPVAALFAVDCPRCFGQRHDCELCGGSGDVNVDRCPWSTMTAEIAAAIEGADLIESGGILPVAGGWQEQSATAVEAMRLVFRARGRIEKEKAEKDATPRG